jgi:4-amino-4-deoxy-L-arabinose transferase-like glycosyltransferase
MEEPSVLDYVIAKLSFRRNADREVVSEPESSETPDPTQASTSLPESPAGETHATEFQPVQIFEAPRKGIPWRALLALFFALVAQLNLEPPHQKISYAVIFYAFAAMMLVWAFFSKEWEPAALPPDESQPPATSIRTGLVYLVIPWAILSFFFFQGDRFTVFNVLVWAALIAFLLWTLWVSGSEQQGLSLRVRLQRFLRKPSIDLHISGWELLVMGVVVIAVFYRFYQLYQIPGQPFSDHAEKLLDVSDVLGGKTSIFFTRNTGREAIQFYWTAMIIKLLGTGVSFMSLKIGTVLFGLLTLPYVYLLGKEIGGRKVALMALLLTGVAYWPNVISRIGLRFPLYPVFAAPTLYYFFRGLRTSNRNDYLFSGLFLGLGLHGYSPMRIVPFVLVALIGLYLLHPQARGKRSATVTAFILLAVVAFIAFIPLFRVMVDDPTIFGYRAFSRLGTKEQAYPGPVWLIFLSNLWNAMVMFFYSNGDIWVHSVVNRPALDVVTAALFFCGLVLLTVRYIRTRRWQDLLLVVSIPLLMMPSILSLAFPNENPSLNRTGGAYIPVMIVAAIALDGLMTGLWRAARSRMGRFATGGLVAVLLIWCMAQNADLVFHQFKVQFNAAAWNTYEIGDVVRSFADSIGSIDTAYVVPYPYWVDTRLVGINAGYPTKDTAIAPNQFAETKSDPRAKLFILKQEDQENIAALKKLYPNGTLQYHKSTPYEGKDFWLFLVPAAADVPGENVQ